MKSLGLLLKACFASPLATVFSLALLALALALGAPLLHWAVLDASLSTDPAQCGAAGGACWGVVREKAPFILLGRYPAEERWRAVLASALILGPWLLGAAGRLRGRALLATLLPAPGLAALLLGGGFGGLSPVPAEAWGGLPLSLLLTAGGLAGALPLALLIAYGRRHAPPALAGLLRLAVDLARSLPLVAVLFAASFLLPLFFKEGAAPGVLLRVQVAIIVFAAAYLSEILRGGLQAFSAHQRQSAAALGMGPLQIEGYIVLPQVFRAVAPSLANNAMALFKDTSLVTVVSLYELTGSLGLALSGDPLWRPHYLEAWIFIAVVYWGVCGVLERLSGSRAQGAGLNTPST